MSSVNPGVQPGTGSQTEGVPGATPPPQGKVATADADAFDSALEKKATGEAGQNEEKLLTPEEQLRKQMSENVIHQVIERSREFNEETKKNLEG